MHSSLENLFPSDEDNWLLMCADLKGKMDFAFYCFIKSQSVFLWWRLQKEMDRDSSNFLPKGLSFRSLLTSTCLCFWCFQGLLYWWYNLQCPREKLLTSLNNHLYSQLNKVSQRRKTTKQTNKQSSFIGFWNLLQVRIHCNLFTENHELKQNK